MIIKLLLAFALALAVSFCVGMFFVPFMRRIKAGQSIREDGPTWHMSKQGTPTMGGVIFIAGVISGIVFVIGDMAAGNYVFITMLAFSLVYSAIGFLDDFEKVKFKRNLGLTAGQKFMLQLAVAVVLIIILRINGHLSPNLYVPFFRVTWIMPEWLYYVLAAFIIVGTVNAVNITDGIDGLAAGVSLPVALACGAIAFKWGYLSVGVFSMALAGGLVGFLIFNFHPAKIFMGDTGSLFLGGAICAIAFGLDCPLALVPLGIVYIVETMSDIIQVAYFKATHGKRIFKMAPLHHHFEMCGWNEYKVFTVFTAVSALFCVLAYFGVYDRFMI